MCISVYAADIVEVTTGPDIVSIMNITNTTNENVDIGVNIRDSEVAQSNLDVNDAVFTRTESPVTGTSV